MDNEACVMQNVFDLRKAQGATALYSALMSYPIHRPLASQGQTQRQSDRPRQQREEASQIEEAGWQPRQFHGLTPPEPRQKGPRTEHVSVFHPDRHEPNRLMHPRHTYQQNQRHVVLTSALETHLRRPS